MRRAAARRLAWALVLTLATTVVIFVLDPVAGRTPLYEPPPEAYGPWYSRYADWLAMLPQWEFPQGVGQPFGNTGVTVAVYETLAATIAMLPMAGILMTALTLALGTRSPRGRSGTAAALSLVSVPLAWLAGTVAVLAERMNEAAGIELLPTRSGFAVREQGMSLVTYVLESMHRQLFPALLLTAVVLPALQWYGRRSAWFRIDGDLKPEIALARRTYVLVGWLVRLLPALAFGAIAIELATDSSAAGRLLLRASWDGYAYTTAGGVLLLGLILFGLRWFLEMAALWVVVDLPLREPQRQSVRPERVLALWSRLRRDVRARVGAAMVALVVLLACYARLWFSTGPHDVVSSDGATPPSSGHWLGVDPLGRDALVRLSAAIGGSLLVAVVAATIAVLLGFGWILVATRVPRGLARPTLALPDLLAVPAGVWIALPGGQDMPTLGFAGDRVTLALALGLVAVPFVARVLWRRCEFMLRSENTPMRPAGALAGVWLATAGAALSAEHVATFLLVRLDERAPTLGAVLARTVFERDVPLAGPDAMTTWPWLWYPPAMATTVLVAGFALLATAALRPGR